MSLVEGVHHVTFLTEDLDRLVAFYERVFEANKTLDMTEEGFATSSSRSGGSSSPSVPDPRWAALATRPGHDVPTRPP